MRDLIGGASAATLGYITGGIKGAKYAAESYRNYAKTMSPIPRSPPNTPKKRKHSATTKTTKRRATESGTKRRVMRVRRRAGPISSKLSVVPASLQKGFKARRKGIKKRVKVSRQLRKKILQVLDSDACHGKYIGVHYYAFAPGVPFQSTPVQDQCTFEFAGIPEAYAPGSNDNRLLFSPQWVRYAVQRLVGGQASSQTVYWQDNDNNGTLDAKIARIKVLKQSATYRIRNNTARVVTLRIMCWSPKSVDYTRDVGTNPYDAWNQALNTQNSITGQNPTGTTPFTLYNTPKYLKEMKARYQMDETFVDIPPGMEHVYKVDGPTMEYDFSKYWKDTTFYDMQKFTKQVAFIAYNDLVKTSLGTLGRFTDNTIPSSGSVIVEQTCFLKFAIPEQAGFIWPAGGFGINKGVSLKDKRYVFGIENFQQAQAGGVQYIEDENPQAFAANNV